MVASTDSAGLGESVRPTSAPPPSTTRTYTPSTNTASPPTTRARALIWLGRIGWSAGLQEGQHRHHAPVRHVLVGQSQLLEHGADVLLHRPLAHEQRRRDGGVVAAGRHLLQDLSLAPGEPRKRPLACAFAGDQRLDDLGVEHRAASAHLVQRPDELVDVADPFLEEVTQAGDAVDEQLEGVVLLDVLGQHDDPHAGMLGHECAWRPRCLRWCASGASGCRSARRPARSPRRTASTTRCRSPSPPPRSPRPIVSKLDARLPHSIRSTIVRWNFKDEWRQPCGDKRPIALPRSGARDESRREIHVDGEVSASGHRGSNRVAATGAGPRSSAIGRPARSRDGRLELLKRLDN